MHSNSHYSDCKNIARNRGLPRNEWSTSPRKKALSVFASSKVKSTLLRAYQRGTSPLQRQSGMGLRAEPLFLFRLGKSGFVANSRRRDLESVWVA